jgi:hypothetical protein
MKSLGKKAVFIVSLIIVAIFNIAAWLSRSFADFFTDNIFPVLTQPFGRLTSLTKISVGERLLVLLVMIVIVTVFCLIVTAVFLVRKKSFPEWLKKLRTILIKTLPALFLAVAVIMSMNCFVLYHCTPIKVGEIHKDSYTVAELAELRDYVVEKCNEMSLTMARDEDGCVIFEGDMAQTAKEAAAGLGGRYKRFGGYFVTPKVLTFSGFMSQQYMQGYYFPFSMEANINGEMYIMNKPFTMCHELAHTKGYIYEDEANFLGFLACIESEDPVFVYSGYLGVLAYVNNDFYDSVDKEEYRRHVAICEEVLFDSQFLTDKAWEEVEKRAVLDTEFVKKAADTFIDTNLKVNGISQGKASYSHVVGLLLDYYSNNSYN